MSNPVSRNGVTKQPKGRMRVSLASAVTLSVITSHYEIRYIYHVSFPELTKLESACTNHTLRRLNSVLAQGNQRVLYSYPPFAYDIGLFH